MFLIRRLALYRLGLAKQQRLIALLAVTLWCCTMSRGQGGLCGRDFPHDSNPTKITDDDVCNFHLVDSRLYRGGRPRPSAYPKLIELGIRTIINLEEKELAKEEETTIEELNRTLAPEQRIDFVSFPIHTDEIERWGVSHKRMNELFQKMQASRGPIFVHCYHGKDRTGAVVAVYRLRLDQKSYKDAYEEAVHYLFSPRDHGLKDTIDRYKSPKHLQSLPRPAPQGP